LLKGSIKRWDDIERSMSKRKILACVILLLIVISLTGIASGDGKVEDADTEDLKDYAEKLVSLKNHKNAGILYQKIAVRYSNESDWSNASCYYVLAGDNFVTVKEYELAAATFLKAGNCYHELRDCENASLYYNKGAELYKTNYPEYDSTWIEEKIEQCKERSLISTLLIVGILLATIKFSSKTAFGCAFATLRKREILAVASFYFAVPFTMSILLGKFGGAYEFVNILMNSWVLLGLMHLIIALVLLVLGLYTVKKWVRSKKDITRKTFILMAIPCPVCGATMFIACALLIILGMSSVLVGLLVGGIFFATIIGLTFGIRELKERKNLSPSSLGSVMTFFGLLYFLSLLLIPAYLPVKDMEIIIAGVPASDVIAGMLFMLAMTAIGFLKQTFEKSLIKKRTKKKTEG